MELDDIQGKVYGPIGRCIYCGSNGGPDGLRTEHPMPFSLGGNAKLLEASCRCCEGKTSYIDGYLAKNIFYDLRIHTGTQSRRKKDIPTVRPAIIAFQDRDESREFQIKDHPFFTVLPLFVPPGLVRFAQPTEAFEPYKASVYHHFPDGLSESLGANPGEKVGVRARGVLNLATFGRAISKIAYCHAIIKFGLDGFYHGDLPRLILGQYPYIPHLFGGDGLEDPPPPGSPTVKHTVSFESVPCVDLKLLVARIRLFANSGTSEHGMPIYQVVVGTPRTI